MKEKEERAGSVFYLRCLLRRASGIVIQTLVYGFSVVKDFNLFLSR